MKYYALFLNTDGFIEQCLALIRFICKPSSKSCPHITVRVYRSDHLGLDEIIKEPITYVNMIEAGAFNLDNNNPPYIVYIRFESEELEAIDYKPDFPMSFMHLTLYEGNDFDFAKALLKELKTLDLHARLSFDNPLYLRKNTIGKDTKNKAYGDIIDGISRNILGIPIDTLLSGCDSNDFRLCQIRRVLSALNNYYNSEYIVRPDSTYNPALELQEENINLFFYDNNQNTIKTDGKNTVYVTPPEYAKEMVALAFKYFSIDNDIYFGDSAIGTGALYLALLRYLKESRLNNKIVSAIGVDIDRPLALEAKRRYAGRGLKVIWGDSLLPQIEPFLGKKRNIMLVNPPYSRYEEIGIIQKKEIIGKIILKK